MTITLASTPCFCYENWVSFTESKGEGTVLVIAPHPQDCASGTQCDTLDGAGN